MRKSGFYDIVRTEYLHISLPETGHFSIGTSPYYAHQHGLAIDIYQNLSLENYEVLSPVAGKVLKIKPLIAPKPKFIGGIAKDFLILINNPSNPKLIWKLMHVKPSIRVGDEINIADPLGKTIRNGYFAYWSSPHLHLEVRPSDDAIRARGGKNFTLISETEENQGDVKKKLDYRDVPVEIVEVHPEFLLVRFPESFYYKITPIHGIRVVVNQDYCLLDGGIPHYKVGTVISDQYHLFKVNNSVYLGTKKIGTLHETKEQFGFLKFNSIKFFINDKEIRGISLYLAKFLPLVKIIPYEKKQFSFKPNSIQCLSIS
ncbi:MAG: hypothetical protein ACFFA3_00090 [Promethearchaeota archaeon]